MARDPFTFLEWVESWSPAHFSGELSAGWFGVLIGLRGNLLAECSRLVLVGPWLSHPDSPDDILPLVGAEYRMPRYPLETAAQYRARLLRAFEIHDFAGTPACINGQIADAQLVGEVLFQPMHPGPAPDFLTPYWSQFWITTTSTSAEELTTLRQIARRWKPVEWILRYLIVETPALLSPTGDHVAVDDGAVGA